MAIKKQQQAEVPGVNFGELSFYAAGGGVPPGDYALEFSVQMFQATTQTGVSRGPARLGVMVHAHSLTDPAHTGDGAYSQFYSMGSSADKSFAPNPETGKGLVAVPGGPATTLNNSTNWAIFLKSLYDCGLPAGVFSNDLSVLDGVHVHLTNVPEPEERKGFQSKTSEVQEDRKPGMISVVTEIKDDGKPWEGTGGIPTATTAATKPNGKPAPAAAAQTKAAPKKAAPSTGGEDTMEAALNGATTVLEKNINGLSKLAFRTQTFTAVKAAYGDDVAQAVQEGIFTDEGVLTGLLGQLGYKIEGTFVKPA